MHAKQILEKTGEIGLAGLKSLPVVNVVANLVEHRINAHRMFKDFWNEEKDAAYDRSFLQTASSVIGNLAGLHIDKLGATILPRHPIAGTSLIVAGIGIAGASGVVPPDRILPALKEGWIHLPFAHANDIPTLGLTDVGKGKIR